MYYSYATQLPISEQKLVAIDVTEICQECILEAILTEEPLDHTSYLSVN